MADLEGVAGDDFGIGGTVEALGEIWEARLGGIVCGWVGAGFGAEEDDCCWWWW